MAFELNYIYNSDSIDLLKRMKKEGIVVDAIITDPPYNISRKNNFQTIGRQGVEFGEWDHDFNQTKWLRYIKYVLKYNGNIVIFNDWKNMGDISKELERQGFEIKDLIRWVKPAPMPRNVERRYVSDAEYALWAVNKNKESHDKNKQEREREREREREIKKILEHSINQVINLI